jgi:hypothetical protein
MKSELEIEAGNGMIGNTSMGPESRRQYVDGIIDALRAKELNSGSAPISDFDKARLFTSLGLLIHDGLTANAAATKDLTQALAQASSDLQTASAESAKTARGLKNYTIVLAIATALLVITSAWQAYEMHEANIKPVSRSAGPEVQPDFDAFPF